VPDDVADRDPDAAVRQRQDVVPVPADLVAVRADEVPRRHRQAADLGQRRQQAVLPGRGRGVLLRALSTVSPARPARSVARCRSRSV
jgi:hypothetical protein